MVAGPESKLLVDLTGLDPMARYSVVITEETTSKQLGQVFFIETTQPRQTELTVNTSSLKVSGYPVGAKLMINVILNSISQSGHISQPLVSTTEIVVVG
jgi:hypothetical protein